MKNTVAILLFSLFLTVSVDAVAQDNTVITTAITSISNNKDLSDKDKKKFTSRLEIIATKSIEIQEKEYNRIAENYKKTTGLDLPKFKSDKE